MNGNLWRARLLAAFGVIACVLLGACGGGDDQAAAPTPTPKFSSSSGAAQSSSPTPTESSSGVPGETPEAFVRRWNELSTSMQNSGDTTAYLAASQSCRACAQVAGNVSSYYAAGGSVTTLGWKLASLGCRQSATYDMRCTATVASAPTMVKKSSDADVENLGGGALTALFYLTRLDTGAWNLANLEEQAE